MQQRLNQFFLSQEAGDFGNNRKGIAKTTAKVEKIYLLYISGKYLLCLQSNTNGSFLQKCINFVEQQLKFAHLKGNKYLIYVKTELKFIN